MPPTREHTAPSLQAVVFDLDDTLYLERDFVRSGYRAVDEHLRDTLQRYEPFEDWLWRRFLAGQARNAFDALDEHFRLNLSEATIATLIDVYRFHEPAIQPCPGVTDLLRRLGSQVRLGLISDGPPRMQRNKLHALGLIETFGEIVLTGELGPEAGKPSPKAFLKIQGRFDVPHDACCYVADNPAKDFLTPNQLGWTSIRYFRDGQVYATTPAPPGGEPQVTVRTDSELLHCLRIAP
jgi:putative hydrolase of the HAD superfamily